MRERIQQRVHNISNIPLSDITITARKRLDYQSNNLYDVHFEDSHWIAKEFVKEDEFLDAPRREYDALKLLETFDIAPVPIDYLPYPEFEHPVVIYEFMPGEMWDRRKPSQDELKALAETWLITHQATKDGLWLSRGWDETEEQRLAQSHWFYTAYLEWAELHFPDGVKPVKEAIAFYDIYHEEIQKLCRANPALLFSRSDPRFANIIARPDGRIGFVDWEDSGLRSPIRTIADLLLHPNQEDLLSDTEWQIFLDIYFNSYPVQSNNLRQLLRWYKLVGSLMWLGGLLYFGVQRARQGTLTEWQINGMPANQRLRRYLARAKGWADDSFESQLARVQDLSFFP